MNRNIKRLRKSMGITQVKLAEMVGVGSSTVTQWETGARRPTVDMIPRLAKALGCSIDELFAGVERSA